MGGNDENIYIHILRWVYACMRGEREREKESKKELFFDDKKGTNMEWNMDMLLYSLPWFARIHVHTYTTFLRIPLCFFGYNRVDEWVFRLLMVFLLFLGGTIMTTHVLW